jgi:hypothetical protein
MQVWAAITAAAAECLPIAQPYNDPPLSHFSFASTVTLWEDDLPDSKTTGVAATTNSPGSVFN